jgi:flagellar biosynthesis anti-sigma factor FlgM
MKINDQGFTERLPASPHRAEEGKQSGTAPTSLSGAGQSIDKLQLSSVASQLQSMAQTDSGRSARISQIAKAVQSNTYQVDAGKIGAAMVSEAVRSTAS